MEFTVNKKKLSYPTEGKVVRGKNEVLLEKAIDLTSSTPWKEKGFFIARLFSEGIHTEFQNQIELLLKRLWKSSGLEIPKNFKLENYHELTVDPDDHFRAVEKTKLLSIKELPFAGQIIETISELTRFTLEPLNPFDNESIFHFRVIRPNSKDNNPLHRDVWLEDYKDCINLYIPIAGSNEDSSLIILPESHHWPESRIERTESGAVINGIKFNVPAVTAIFGECEFVRPDPRPSEVLIFSPYLIHGGSVNLSSDQTRISIELRLWKKHNG
jgi:hypothetical protein